MVDAADGHSPTIRSSRAHGFLRAEVGEAPVRVTFVLTPEQRRTLADELESGGAAGDPAGSIRAGGLGLTLGQTVGLHAVLSCESSPACAALAKKLADARDARARDIAVRLVGFGAVLERIALEPKGDLVHARVELPAEEATLLAERLLTLRGMRHPMPGASGSPSAGASSEPRGAEARPVPPVRPDEVITPDAGAAKRTPADGRARDGGAPP
jgi:hypothetical protein